MGKRSITTLCCYLALQTFTLAEDVNAAKFNLNASTDFIAEKASAFVINERSVGPFGKPQDPHKKIIDPQINKPGKPTTFVTKKEQQILIEKEINKLGEKLNIMGRRAIIGSKTYTRGDKINVSVKGKIFPLKFNSIMSGKITFLDLSDKSIISLDMKTRSVISTHDTGPTIGLDSNKTDTLELEE